MNRRLVTVFGGSGFLGRYIVKRLAEAGAQVRVAIRRPEEGLFLKPAGDVGQIDVVQANLRHPGSVAAAIAGAEAAVNLVGILYPSGAQTFEAVHVEGARTVARAAAEAGLRHLVHVSAIGADPESPAQYARTKAAGEAAVRAAFPAATILRPSVVFGPEDDFLNRFATLARISPVLPLIGGGHTRFQPVYVGDVAAAVLAALNRADAVGRIYELGGPRTYSLRELLGFVLSAIGRQRLLAPIPFWVASLEAAFLERLPAPLLTRDQVRLLRRDNVVGPGVPGLRELGVQPTPLEAVAETYLSRFRRGGARPPSRNG